MQYRVHGDRIIFAHPTNNKYPSHIEYARKTGVEQSELYKIKDIFLEAK